MAVRGSTTIELQGERGGERMPSLGLEIPKRRFMSIRIWEILEGKNERRLRFRTQKLIKGLEEIS